MMQSKKLLIACWTMIFVLVGLYIFWDWPKNDQGIVTQKISTDQTRSTYQIVIDDSRHYQFANYYDWIRVKEKSVIKIVYKQLSIYPIFIPTIEEYEIIKKPPIK